MGMHGVRVHNHISTNVDRKDQNSETISDTKLADITSIQAFSYAVTLAVVFVLEGNVTHPFVLESSNFCDFCKHIDSVANKLSAPPKNDRRPDPYQKC